MTVADHPLPTTHDEASVDSTPKPPRCSCGDSVPASTQVEAEALRREFEAGKGLQLDQTREVTYYTCRDNAWHSVESSATSDCPCGRPAWASPLDRNRAARIISAQEGTGAVRARGFTCRSGGFHWEWGPKDIESNVAHCRCGLVRYKSEEAAEAVAAYYRARYPEDQVDVFQCWRPRWHVRHGAPRPPMPEVDRCACGKAASTTRDDSEILLEQVVAATGSVQTEVRHYRCAHGSWHWTSHLSYENCVCGSVMFETRSLAIRAANRALRRVPTAYLSPRAYQCRHGAHHWAWYPYAQQLSTCFCGRVRYLSRSEARLVADFRTDHYPTSRWTITTCAGGWHVTGHDMPGRPGPTP